MRLALYKVGSRMANKRKRSLICGRNSEAWTRIWKGVNHTSLMPLIASRRSSTLGVTDRRERYNVSKVTLTQDLHVPAKACPKTGQYRNVCGCSECWTSQNGKHGPNCRCSNCFPGYLGAFIDELGLMTASGGWRLFMTITYRTKGYPWAKGFPYHQPSPSPDFASKFFSRTIRWLEGQVHARVEYFVADQYGETGGRFHQHAGLSWPGLFPYRWKPLQQMLWKGAGYNRILPWKTTAAYYIGRFVGRDANRCNWDFRVGAESVQCTVPVGRTVVAPSAELSSNHFRNVFRGWHR